MLQKLRNNQRTLDADYTDQSELPNPKSTLVTLESITDVNGKKRAESLQKTEKISLPEIHMYHQMKAYGGVNASRKNNLVEEMVAQGLHMQF